jgi:hypothetical protein
MRPQSDRCFPYDIHPFLEDLGVASQSRHYLVVYSPYLSTACLLFTTTSINRMTDLLQLNDFISVKTAVSNKPLEGAVAFLGTVDFDTNNDWVGVRLTGKSVGQGNNDGTVQGKSYFKCPAACGMFVRAASVTKRSLTRLEELRLNWELGISTKSGSSTAAGPRTPPRPAASGRLTTTPVAASTVDTAAGAAPTPSTAARTSREEIRLRRLALAAKKQEVQQKASTPPHITIPSSPTGHIAAQVQNHLTKQVTDLQHKYSEKENQAAALCLVP